MKTSNQRLKTRFKPFRYEDAAHYLQLHVSSEPVYLFSEAQLKLQAKLFKAKFNGELSYAVKANPHPLVLDCLWAAGVRSFDVASVGEIAMIKQRYKSAQCHYNNPIRSDEMLRAAAFDYGVRSFAIDDLTGLAQIAALNNTNISDLEVSIRFKLDHFDAAYDFGSKFGATLPQAADLLKRADALGLLCSLTFHPGSQCTDPLMYQKHISAAAQLAKKTGVRLHRLNVGGGFPLAYENTRIEKLKDYMDTIEQAVQTSFGDLAPQLICEPGRALVGASTSLMTQVIRVRSNNDVFINDGIYGGLQEQLMARLDLPYRIWRDGKLLANPSTNNHASCETDTEAVQVFGPTCDPTDRLPNKLMLPADIKAGDYIEFGLLGAYGSATATQFNGFSSERYAQVKRGYYQ